MVINDKLVSEIKQELGISEKQIKVVLTMLSEGNTVPFIARYRKEQTGALDEEQIRSIDQVYTYRKNLEERKEDVIRLIDEKGMLTPELKQQIMACTKLVDVEDLYRPYKEKKKTKASEAIKMGLEPLAFNITDFEPSYDPYADAKNFINEQVKDEKAAIEGAKFIIAEWISDNADHRKWIRNYTFKNGLIATKVKKGAEAKDEKQVYSQYYEYSEPIRQIKSHRILAINRAEKEKIITVSLDIEKDNIISYIQKGDANGNNKQCVEIVKEAIEDSYKRLIKPSIEREIRAEFTGDAEDNAIKVFSDNLRNLLLQPPMKGKVVLGVDPAFRTGCKLAVVSETGKLQYIDKIYPTQMSKGEKVPEKRIKDAQDKVVALCKKFKAEIIAIGNGTASRETEQFVVDTIKLHNLNVQYIIVNEAGASVWSASKSAQAEFPKLSVEERSAASIARRLQDPLSELVKIDPKSIGVGQYQHDVTQSKLNESLEFVVSTAVNQVGVNINTASESLLQHVAGLTKTQAKNIVAHRNDPEVGRFNDRKEIKKVKGLGPKSYEQAIGFLRILNGKEPLDMTGIHPESYEATEKLLKYLEVDKNQIGNKELVNIVKNVNKAELAKELSIDKYTLDDIIDSLVAPMRDPRDKFDAPVLKSDLLKLEDLKTGMELQGTVRNVIDFGAFVDCGVKEDGLVHISKITTKFIKHPSEMLSVGDIVKVFVLDVDLKRKRLALSMLPIEDIDKKAL